MAFAPAETGAVEEAATILKTTVNGGRDGDGPLAGRTHARKALPRPVFAA